MGKYSFILLTVIVVVLLVSFKCNGVFTSLKRIKSEINSTKDSTTHYKNLYNQEVAESNKVIEATQKQLDKLAREIFNLKRQNEKLIKKTNALIVATQEVKMTGLKAELKKNDSIKSPEDYTDLKIRKKLDGDTTPVKLRTFEIRDTLKTIIGGIDSTKIYFDSIKLNNNISFRLSKTRKGTVVHAINSSPHFTNSDIFSVTVPYKNSRWNKWIKPALAATLGATLTYYATKK